MDPLTGAPTSGSTEEPTQVVEAFLLALQARRFDDAVALLAEDAVYINVSLPSIHGRRRIDRLLRRALDRPGRGFRVHFHTVAASGTTVLTERTDELVFGRIRHRFWAYGRFEVHDGQITVWRDSFDWFDVLVGLVRGLAGAVNRDLNRRWPDEG